MYKKSIFNKYFSLIILLSLIGFQSKAQTDPSLIWAKGFGNDYLSGGSNQIRAIKIDGAGNRYITGYFIGTADFDLGAGTANLTGAGSFDIFLAKYDASGNYLWAKSMGGTSQDQGASLVLDGSGNVLLTGYFSGTVDFDPGAGTANLTSAGSDDIFLAKYDASGNYVWAKSMGGTNQDQGYSLALDGSGNVLLTGYFSGTADFDPGASTANLTSAGFTEIFLAKYDASGNYVWAKRMGGTGQDVGTSIAVDGSGNVLLTGYFSNTADFDPSAVTVNLTSAGNNDIFFAQYDASGNYVWAKRIGGTSGDRAVSLVLDGSGNVLLTGKFAGTVDFDPGAGTVNLISAVGGNDDIFLAKYDASGNYVWAKSMGGTGYDEGLSLALDGSGNVLLTGFFNGTADFDPGAGTANLISAGGNDIFLAKYDALGNYVWAKGMVGTGNEISTALALDGSGNVYVTGNFNGTVDFDPGVGTSNRNSGSNTLNAFVAGYTSSTGTYVSVGVLNSATPTNVVSQSVTRDGSGNVYVTGNFSGTVDFDPGAGTANLRSAGGNDIFLTKYDASGNYVWAKSMGGTNQDQGYSLALDGSGNVLLTGYFSGTADFDPGAGTTNLTSAGSNDIFLAKYDASGIYVWAKRMGSTYTDVGYSLALDGSGNVVVTGSFNGVTNFDFNTGQMISTSTIFLAKYNASGDNLWENHIGGISADVGYSLALDGSGNVVVTGSFSGTEDFDPGAGTANLTSAGSNDIFLAKYNASGNYVWAKRMGGTGADVGNSLALDGSGNAVLTGSFEGTADFNPGSGTANLTSAGSNDIFLAKYDASGIYVWANGMGGTGSDFGVFLALDGSANVLLTGNFSGTADFDPGAGTANLISAGGNDIFLAQYDASGNYVWGTSIGGTGLDQGNSLVLDGSGNVVLTGYFNGTADFDPSAGTTYLTSMSGGQYGFIAAYGAPFVCTNPTLGGTIAAAQSGTNPFNPAAFTSTVTASGESGTLEYKWQSSTTSNSAGFADIASSNAATYTAGALTVTTWFKRLARVDCSADWTGAVASNVLEVTVISCTPTVNTTTVTACVNYTWANNGQTYSASGTYTGTTTNCVTEQLVLTITALNYYLDADSDGYYTASAVSSCTSPGAGYTLTVTGGGDCDDTNASIHPGAAEICYDGIDNDCDGTVDNGCVPLVSTVQTAQCGQTLASIDSYVYANLVSGVQGYRFKVTNMVTNEVQTIDRFLRVFRITQLQDYAFNTEYQVEVTVRKNNTWQPTYGTPCTVKTPAPTTQLINCGASLTAMADVIYANSVAFATGYQFKVTNVLNPSDTRTINRSLREFRMNTLSGIEFNTTYNVEVAVRNTDGVYLPYGATCAVTTPNFPSTYIQDSQCDDYVVPSMSTSIYAVSFTGAEAYRFRLQNEGVSYSQEVDKYLRVFKLTDFTGLLPGSTYTVKVALKINGVWGSYTGKSCSIIIPGSARAIETEAIVVKGNFAAVAYPNPFATTFAINVQTTSTAVIQMKVYDMLGRLVEQRETNAKEITAFGERYPSGVFSVVVTQGGITETLRVIKR